MNNTKNSYFITTAIDYATGNPHIGHAYEKIASDVIARFERLLQKDVRFLTGTDEHGQKVVQKAQEQSLSPQEFVDRESKKFQDLTKTLNLQNDFFIRTTQENHKQFVQKMLQISYDNNDIYLGTYEGLYCVGCEKYYTEDELLEGNICPDHKKPVLKLEQENYFFKLSKYQDKLLELYEQNPKFISPKHRRDEIINRVKGGLQDISISRPREFLSWGIDLPFDLNHVTYVWFDALFNYAGYGVQEGVWPADTHIIGKDISWFHLVYWPAFLMSVGLELPKKVFTHGMVLDEKGHKMSKSLGNVIDPFEEIKTYGLDEFRFYIMQIGSFGEDCRYSREECSQVIETVLNNGLGNLVSRLHTMTQKYCESKIPQLDNNSIVQEDEEMLFAIDIKEEIEGLVKDIEISKIIQVITRVISLLNGYVNKTEPYKEKDITRRNQILAVLHYSIFNLVPYISAIMPQKAITIVEQFNYPQKLHLNLEELPSDIIQSEKIKLFEKAEQPKRSEVKKSKEEQEKRSEGKNNIELNETLQSKILISKEKRKEVRAIIFDFDGVIVDNYDVMYEISKKTYGISKEDHKKLFEGNVNTTTSSFDANKEKEFWTTLDSISKKLIVEKRVKKELLQLKDQYDLFCVTSNIEENIVVPLHNSSLEGLFVEIYGKEKGNCKTEKINTLLEKYGLNKDEVVFVTDTLGDIKEANEVEILTIAVDFGFHEKERLQRGAPYKIVSSFKQIRKEVEKLQKHTISHIEFEFSKKLENKKTTGVLHTLHPIQKNTKLALFVHGFCAHKFGCKSQEFKWQLLAEEYDFLCFDFLGCGDNEQYPISIHSQRCQVEEIIESMTQSRGYEEIVLVGHSLGGLHILSLENSLISKKVAIAPLCFSISLENLYLKIGITEEQKKALKENKECIFKDNEKEYILSRAFFSDYTQISQKKLQKIANKENFQTLILQAENDSIIPASLVREFNEGCDDKKVKYFEIKNGTHSFKKNTQEGNEIFYAKMRSFIKNGIQKPKLKFSNLRLQIGEIIEVKDHPQADRLYIEHIDFGDYGVRQIVSGLRDHFSKEEMLHKKVLVLTNLKTGKFRGIESQGMVLLVEDKENTLGFIVTKNDVKNGSFIRLSKRNEEGTENVEEVANSSDDISVDEFFTSQLYSKNLKVYFKELNEDSKAGILKCQDEELTLELDIEGNIR